MSNLFILDGHRAIPATLMQWAQWYETADRRVAKTTIGEIDVSTVFLGIDHSFGDRVPILFETMVFGGELDERMERYATWQDAEEGHRRWVKKVEAKQ